MDINAKVLNIDWTERNKGFFERFRKFLYSEGMDAVDSTNKARAIGIVEEEVLGRTKELETFKLKMDWQLKVLRGMVVLGSLLAGFLWWRLVNVEEIALAKAMRIMYDRGRAASEVGGRAAGYVVDEIRRTQQGVLDDKEASTEVKRMRLEYMDAVLRRAYELKTDFDANVKKFDVKIPDRITSVTIVKDPFTGVMLPLNATKGAEVDRKLLEKYLKDDHTMLGLVAVARTAAKMDRRRADGGIVIFDPGTLEALGIRTAEMIEAAKPKLREPLPVSPVEENPLFPPTDQGNK